ncbi:MAG TPA: hypothetical protein VN660_02515 [Steroidobacteraceae bacterium]|nr:hypothetical protein [Steroidobacteraceae bacterium]
MSSLQALRSKLQKQLLHASHRLQSLAYLGAWSDAGLQEAKAIADLEYEGVHVTSVEQLFGEAASQIRATFAIAAELTRESSQASSGAWTRRESSTDLRPDVLLTRVPVLYLLGLDTRLLSLVQRYLRLPVAYHGAVVRCSKLDGGGVGTRLWHQDAEDFHVFRVVIYMNDVTPGGGPFEYIARRDTPRSEEFADGRYVLTNEQMSQLVPMERWKRVYGPAGTVVIADTAQVFHHESLQTDRERMVTMIGYSSRRPRALKLAMAHFPAESLAGVLKSVVPVAKQPHVFNWRRAAGTQA